MASTIYSKAGADTAIAAAIADATTVDQITLTAPLALTLPVGYPTGAVYRCAITQDGTGGHTVTYGGNPVTVDTTAGAETLVEVWPGGTLVYPGTAVIAGSSGALIPVTTNTTPADGTAAGQLVGYWNTGVAEVTVAAVAVPAGQSIILAWNGSAWVQPSVVGAGSTPTPDTTPPTPGTLASSAITDASFTLTVSGAADAGGLDLAPYAFSVDNGSTWSAWQAAATFASSGLTAETAYQCQHKVRDAAANEATGTAITVTTGAPVVDTTPPAPGTLSASTPTIAAFTLTVTGASDAGSGLHAAPYSFSLDNGSTWSAWQEAATFAVTDKTPATAYQCQHKVRDAAPTPNEATGTAITVTTASITDTGLAAAIEALAPSGYWKLNEAAGATVAADSSGNGRTGDILSGTMDGSYAAGATIRVIDNDRWSITTSGAGLSFFFIGAGGASDFIRKGTAAGQYEIKIRSEPGSGKLDAIAYQPSGDSGSQALSTNTPFAGGTPPNVGACVTFSTPYAMPVIYAGSGAALASTGGAMASGYQNGVGNLVLGGSKISHVAAFPRVLTAGEVGGLMDAARAQGLIP